MFLGQFEHTLDDKHRLTLPARYRERFNGGVVLAPGMDRCLSLYALDDWNRFVDHRLAGLDPLSRDGRVMTRYIFGRSVELDSDRQGRIQVPAHLRSHAGLDRQVVLAGVRDHLELWDHDEWTRFVAEAEQHVHAIAEGLSQSAPADRSGSRKGGNDDDSGTDSG